MKLFLKKPYIFLLFGLFFGYLILVFALSDFGTTLQTALLYSETVNWQKLAFSLFLTLVIASLIAINGCYVYKQYKLRNDCKKGSAVASVGVIGGLAVGICPLCVGGILPILIGVFGISFSFGALPFQGIEIQLLVIALLLGNLLWMKKRKYL
jgi:hypothetical protein